jgi:hypothetical protein
MRKIIQIVLIIGAMSIWRAFADDMQTNDWGVTNCGARMLIALKEINKEIKTNQPVNLVMCITNISDSVLYLLDISIAADFSFVITSPSNQDVSPKISSGDIYVSRTVQRYIAPNGSINYSFDLRSVCNFNEIGTYEVVAKRKLLGDCELVSNPLDIKVVPGVWKATTTNTPPAGF